MALVPPVPMPKQDLRDWALKTANYLQLLEKAAEQPSPKVVQLERKQPTAKATMDGLLMFDAQLQAPTYSFNKQWYGLASKTDLNAYVKKTGDVMTGSLAVDGGSGWGLKITSGYPSIWFYDDNFADPALQHFGLSAGNGWFRFYVSSDTGGSVTDLFTINPANNINAYLPFQSDYTITAPLRHKDAGGYFMLGSYGSTYGTGSARIFFSPNDRKIQFSSDTNSNPTSLELGAGSLLTNTLCMSVSAGNNYISNSQNTYIGFNVQGVTNNSTIAYYFRDVNNTSMAAIYGPGTSSPNAVGIITREKGDLRYAAASSRRFKRDITKAGLPDLVRVFDALGLSLFTWGGEIPKEDERFGKRSVGFIAEEVVELLPEAGVYFNTNFLRTTFEERDVVVVIDKEEEGPVEVVQRQLFETNEEVEGPLVLHGLDANVLIAMLFAKIKQLEARIP